MILSNNSNDNLGTMEKRIIDDNLNEQPYAFDKVEILMLVADMLNRLGYRYTVFLVYIL